MDLIFQVPMQCCSLQHQTSLPSPVTSTTGRSFLFILSGLISPLFSSSILGTYWPGEFFFQCPIFLPFHTIYEVLMEKEMTVHSSILTWRIPWTEEPGGLLSMGSHSIGHDWSDLACMHALEKEMATHPSVLAWRIPGMVEPGGLPSMGSDRVRHDWSDLAAAAAAVSHGDQFV